MAKRYVHRIAPKQGAEVYIFSDLIENSEYIPGGAFREEPNAALLARIEADNFLPNLEGAAARRERRFQFPGSTSSWISGTRFSSAAARR
jgi:hypothetical protein